MKKGKNCLFISLDGLTDPLGRSQILPYLIGLSEDYTITIISCEKKERFLEAERDINEIVKKSNIKWIPLDYKSKIPILSSYVNYIQLKRESLKLAVKKPFDLVHCRSIIPALVGSFHKKLNNSKLVFDIRGFWADERVEGKIWNRSNPIFNGLYKYFKKKEKQLFELADSIITLTENAKDFIKSNYKTNDNFMVIPCSVDTEHFNYKNEKESSTNQLRKQLSIGEDNYVLGYIGSLGTRYMINEMLQFFKQIKLKDHSAVLLFVTKSDPRIIYEALEIEGISKNDVRITSSNYERIPDYIYLMNASIFFVTVGFSGKAVSPTKQSEVLSMGVPLVANAGLGDTDRILSNGELGVLVNSFNTSELALAADKLLKIRDSQKEIRNHAIEEFSLDKAVLKYKRVYHSVLNND